MINKEQGLWVRQRIRHQGSILTLPLFYVIRLFYFIIHLYIILRSRDPITLCVNNEYFFINYNNERENKIYEKFVPNNNILGQIDKLSIKELFRTMQMSVMNHFFYLTKVRRYILSERLLNTNILKGSLHEKTFIAHDGANFHQKMIALWCIENGISTARIMRENVDCNFTMYNETIPITSYDLTYKVKSKIYLEHPLFISNPNSSQILGLEYHLVLYLLKRLVKKKEFYIRHHPQVPQWKIKISRFIFREKILDNTIPIENYEVKLLVQTYTSTLAIMENVLRVKKFGD